MSFRTSQQARLYLGHLALAAYTRNAAFNSTVTMHEVSVLANTPKAFIPGDHTSTGTADGPLDTDATANGQADALADFKDRTTPTPITYMPLGTDGFAWLVEANAANLSHNGQRSGTADWSLEVQTTGETDVAGVILENNTTVTTDTNGTSVDNGAATSNGAALHLHVTAYSGLTSDAITVEHSTDDSTWATLATFATVTAIGSERVIVSGTVNRYLRVVDDVTGSGSISRLVAVARR